MKPHHKLISALGFCMVSASSQAATITVDMDVDLNDLTISANQVLWANSTKSPSFNFSAGDTLVFNYNFTNGQAMHLTNSSGSADTMFHFFTMRTNSTAVGVVQFDDASITLNGLSGTGLNTPFDHYSNYGQEDANGLLTAAQHGYYLYTPDALLDGADVAFTGFTVEYTHVSGSTAGPWFSYFWINNFDTASEFETGAASSFASSSVPNTGTLALALLGLAGFRLRKRQKA